MEELNEYVYSQFYATEIGSNSNMINSNDTSDVVDVFYNIIHVGITVNIRMALWIVAINKVVVKILHYDSAIHWLYVEQEY